MRSRVEGDRRRQGRAPDLGGDRRARGGPASLSTHVIVSLGTNDPPGEPDAFRADVRRVLGLIGTRRCVVWATIWRDGAESTTFNDVLREAASSNRRLRLVDWAAMVREHPDWLASDGLHGNDVGYRSGPRRSRRRCATAARRGRSGAMTEVLPLATGAELGCATRRRRRGRARERRHCEAVPGTWSAMSELLVDRPRAALPADRVRGGPIPGQVVERARLVHGRHRRPRSSSSLARRC